MTQDTTTADKRRLAAATRWAKANGITVEEQLLRMAAGPAKSRPKPPKQEQAVDGASARVDANALMQNANVSRLERDENQGAVRALLVRVAMHDAPTVYAKLRMLALGLGEFAKAPVVVRRLAMLDILALAGVSTEAGKGGALDKPLNEWGKGELDSFLSALAVRIEQRRQRDNAVTVEPEAPKEPAESTAYSADHRTADPVGEAPAEPAAAEPGAAGA